MRAVYRCLLWLHPPAFRRAFAGEMLWIFDQACDSQGAAALLFDAAGSLGRQWLLRSGWWKYALAAALALLQVTLGGFGMQLFGRRRLVGPARDAIVASIGEFARSGSLAHQPLTAGIVLYLGVCVTAGLVLMILGLALWQRSIGARRPRLARGAR